MTSTMPVVDAHHHFWTPGDYDHYWMAGEALAPIRRPFGPDDMQPLLQVAGVDYTIVVQTVQDVAETREFMQIAAASPFVAGVVGWVDLTSPDVSEEIAALQARPDAATLVGIRHMVHDEADPDWLRRADVLRGISAVRDAGLAYDILIRPREIAAAVAMAQALPDARLVIDHLAKPPIASGEIAEWAALMEPFRAMTHVFCKLSGMITEANWSNWTSEDLKPYVAVALDLFGVKRVMYGSDWPVCLLAGSYLAVKEALEDALPEDLTPTERARVFGGNAIDFYRLQIQPL